MMATAATPKTPPPLRSVSEAEAGSGTDWRPSGRPCPHCQVAGRCYSRVWESDDGACRDEQNECRSCGEAWWVEGADPWLTGVLTSFAAVLRRSGHRPFG